MKFHVELGLIFQVGQGLKFHICTCIIVSNSCNVIVVVLTINTYSFADWILVVKLLFSSVLLSATSTYAEPGNG